MLIRVNKNTGTHRQPVKYAALSSGTISHVWCDEDSLDMPKRRNRITLTTDKSKTLVVTPSHDA